MWLASRLGRGCGKDNLSEEGYVNDDIGLLSFERICGSQHFDASWA